MKIAILSDSHDNIPNIEKALKWINKEGIKTIIHCGDLCAPGVLNKVILPNYKGEIHLVNGNVGDPDKLEEMAKEFKNVHVYNWHYSSSVRKMTKKTGIIMGCGEITIPSHSEAQPKNLSKTRSFAKAQDDNVKIAFTHSPSIAQELAETGKYDYVFYGHTHRPWIEEMRINADVINTADQRGNNISVNQQKNQRKSAFLVNPGTLAGMFYKATFAVLDTETGKLGLKILERL